MKHFFIFLIAFSLFLAVAGTAQEETESSKYNFGTMQPAKELRAAPGDEISTKLYFYNIYGNRITHIVLSTAEFPEGWDVSIEPDVHETEVIISGVPATVEENLYVEPSSAMEEIPSTVPEGIEYISSSVGNIGAKFVTINIKVPESEELGTVGNIVIDTVANWLGQGGTVAISQSRSFEYTITVASEEFTEEIVEPETTVEDVVAEEEVVSEALSEAAESVGEIPTLLSESTEKESEEVAAVTGGGITSTTLLMTVIIALLAVLIFVLVKRKR